MPLVFIELLFSQLISQIDKKAPLSHCEVSSETPKFFNSILLARTGSILKFHLAIPRYLPLQQWVTELEIFW